MAKLTIRADLCTGCLNCQTVCALLHAGRLDRSASAIRVELEIFSGLNSITFCRQCEKPECLKACPVNAIFKDQSSGAWKINCDICVKCGSCVAACPFGAMFSSGAEKLPFKCDLCGGKPACAEACVFSAITFKENH